MATQITNYVDHAHLLEDRISALRKGHSSTTARDDTHYAMKRKEITLMVLADFSKAFHTISFSATIVKFLKTLSRVAPELSIWPVPVHADRQ